VRARRFGFEFTLALSTRPEKYLGQIEQWDDAEAVSLRRCALPV
jgi:threonyl-tRNA synthetase